MTLHSSVAILYDAEYVLVPYCNCAALNPRAQFFKDKGVASQATLWPITNFIGGFTIVDTEPFSSRGMNPTSTYIRIQV
jgi:hypothetical protein